MRPCIRGRRPGRAHKWQSKNPSHDSALASVQGTIMSRLFDEVLAYFQSNNWVYTVIPDQTIVRAAFNGRNGKWTCYAQTREEERHLLFYSVLPVNAPEDKRASIIEFITRANYVLVIGGFEVDMSDGEIRYKTSLGLANVEPAPALLQNVIVPNLLATDQFLPGLMAVLYGGATPENAFAQVVQGGAKHG